ncbi:MAG TPA: DUF1854 domain-containing protein [Clostridiales bacterium]|nr:DUF1854 domain-containing protein [Clostridiales bacterium]
MSTIHCQSKPKGTEAKTEQSAYTDDILKIKYITKGNAKFKRTPGGFVSLEFEGKFYSRVSVYRAFPFTNPDSFISIRQPDEKAEEIGIIRSLNELDKETAEIIREQLNIRYFTPEIKKIIDIKDEYGYAYFDVLTDRGACRFTIRMNTSSVIRLSETRILIVDIDGNRFEIPDITKLSAAELKKLDLFI